MDILAEKARVFEALAKGVIWEGDEALDNLRFLDGEVAAFNIAEYTDPEWSVEKLHLIKDELEPDRIQEIREGAELTPEEEEIFFQCDFESYETASLYRIDGPDGQSAWAVVIRACSSMDVFNMEAGGPFGQRDEALAWASERAKGWRDWSTDFDLQGKEDLTAQFTAAIGAEPREPYC